MAVYAATTTLLDSCKRPAFIDSTNDLKMLVGTINITNYNSTHVEITDVTDYFKDPDHVVVMVGLSDIGLMGTWIQASGTLKCWDASGLSGVATQLGDDTTGGTFNFVAIGR